MSEVLQELSESLAELVERNRESVLSVAARRRPSTATVWSQGVLVTANHAIEWEEDIEVVLPDGRSIPASLQGRDPATDLAALSIAEKLSPPPWGDASGLKVGSLVLAIARPGRSARAGLGVVRALGESWYSRAGGRIDRFIESDLRLFPGYSGSMLVEPSGSVVGMNTSGLRRGAALALPTATVRRVVESLVEHGRVRRGFLGIATYPIRLPSEVAQELDQSAGLLVVSVQPGSAAARAGLLLGDVVLAIDSTPLVTPLALLAQLGEERIDTESTLRVLRAGAVQEISVRVGARSTAERR